MTKVDDKLAILPKTPGVYFHKDKTGEIIYVGKASVLRNRVRQYFQKSRYRDPKTDVLVSEIADIDWIEVDSEFEALFLEAEMIRRYMPKYNILLRDDKSMVYIKVDINSSHPIVTTTRRPLDDGAEYFGPYLSSISVRKALRLLRKVFPFSTSKNRGQKRVSLHYHLGLDPGLEEGRTSLEDYRANLRKLISVIKGNRVKVIRQLEKEMKQMSNVQNYEAAARLRNQIRSLENLHKQILFSDKENLDLSKDRALNDMSELFLLDKVPRRIECYDISHMSGTDTVASMVVFSNGVPDKKSYRKFKMRLPGNNDFAHMKEVLERRFSGKNIKSWGKPDFVIIDGGKGQLSSALEVMNDKKLEIPTVGLAEQFEEIVTKRDYEHLKISDTKLAKLRGSHIDSEGFRLIELSNNTDIVKLFQRIRDESHRFAVSYHSVLKVKRQRSSELDDIEGVGVKSKQKLLRKFGSVKGVKAASRAELVEVVGETRASSILRYFK